MPLIRVREKNQVTLPREIVDFFQAKTPGYIEYKMLPDGVLIRPAQAAAANASDEMTRLLRLSAPKSVHGKGNSVDVDAYVNAMGDE